jgi:hypothetical protein
LLAQPGLKALAAQRPGFPVAVDDEIGKAGAVDCVKERRRSVLLTALDRRPLALWQPDRAATRSYRQGPRQLMESPGVPRDPPGDALAHHRVGFVARADGRP